MEAVLKETTPDTLEAKLGDQVEAVRQDLNELGRIAGTTARHKLGAARDRGRHLVEKARTGSVKAVKRRPLGAVVTAAAMGALAGLLLSWK